MAQGMGCAIASEPWCVSMRVGRTRPPAAQLHWLLGWACWMDPEDCSVALSRGLEAQDGRRHPEALGVGPAPGVLALLDKKQGWNEPMVETQTARAGGDLRGYQFLLLTGGERAAQRGQCKARAWHAGQCLRVLSLADAQWGLGAKLKGTLHLSSLQPCPHPLSLLSSFSSL